MPSDPKISRFYSILLHGLEVNLRHRPRVSDLEIMALQMLKNLNVRILIIDETHNILAGTTAAQREFLNLLRFLGNQLKIPIVCVGTKEAYFALVRYFGGMATEETVTREDVLDLRDLLEEHYVDIRLRKDLAPDSQGI